MLLKIHRYPRVYYDDTCNYVIEKIPFHSLNNEMAFHLNEYVHEPEKKKKYLGIITFLMILKFKIAIAFGL